MIEASLKSQADADFSSQSTAATPNANHVVDIVLYALADKHGTAVWFEPVHDDRYRDVHVLTIEQKQQAIVTAKLAGGLGDAALARLAFLANLDLLARGAQNGRMQAQVGKTTLDVLVTVRQTEMGLAGELRVLNDVGEAQDVAVASQADGLAYPEVLTSGTMVGPYQVEALLGQGGMGTVYRVQHTHLRKSFAMKLLRKSVLTDDPDAAHRFVREARAAARVQHEGIVDVSDFGSLSDGRHYLVMQLLGGTSLDDMMRDEGTVDTVRALQIMRSVAVALGAAHAAGIVHRDVSPSNIFVERVGGREQVKVVDFGAASLPDADQSDVPDGPAGMVVGTPYYMAPEQAQGLPTDHRSDMYSFGVVLYELVSGTVPFDADTARDIVMKHILESPPPLFSPAKEIVCEELWAVIERMLAKKPEERYQTTDAVVAELDRVLALLSRRGWRKWLPA